MFLTEEELVNNTETKKFSQNVSSSYHLEDRNKNVPKLRFKEYNDEWKRVKTEEIFENISIKNNPLLPVLAVTQDKGVILRESCGINIKYENKSLKSYKIVKPGNFIISLRSFQGGLEYSELEGIVSPAYTILNNKQNISYDFFKYYFKTYNFIKSLNIAVEGIRDGKQISYNSFKDIKIAFPSLPEQEKIASFLTLIDKKIEKQKELVELLKKYKRGLLSQIFSQNLRFKDNDGNDYPAWEEKTINNIFDTVTDFVAAGSFADLRKNVLYNEKPDFAQLVRTVDLKNNFKNKDFVFVNKSAYKYLWRVNLNEDALILPNIGANIGEVYYIYSFKLPYKNNVLGPNAILLKSSNNDLYYLYSGCLTDNFRKQLFLQVGASGQPKFNKTDFKKIKIKISINIDEQSKISKFLSKIDDKIQQEECKLNNLQTHKHGLLQQMFI